MKATSEQDRMLEQAITRLASALQRLTSLRMHHHWAPSVVELAACEADGVAGMLRSAASEQNDETPAEAGEDGTG